MANPTTGTTTALACSGTAATHAAKNRRGLLISNRPTNTLTAYVSLSGDTPVAGALCTFALIPGGLYEYVGPEGSVWGGAIKIVLSGAGPENIDITEQL